MKRIDSAALDSARGKEGLAVTIEQFRFLTKYWSGMPMEKRQLSFPLSKMSPPLVAEAYMMDHHGLDSAFDELNTSYSVRDSLENGPGCSCISFSPGYTPGQGRYPSLPDFQGTNLPARAGEGTGNYGRPDSPGTVPGSSDLIVPLNRAR